MRQGRCWGGGGGKGGGASGKGGGRREGGAEEKWQNTKTLRSKHKERIFFSCLHQAQKSSEPDFFWYQNLV